MQKIILHVPPVTCLLTTPCLLRGKFFTFPSRFKGSCSNWGGRGDGWPNTSVFTGEGAQVEHSSPTSTAPQRFRGSETLPPRRNFITLFAALVLLIAYNCEWSLDFLWSGWYPCLFPWALDSSESFRFRLRGDLFKESCKSWSDEGFEVLSCWSLLSAILSIVFTFCARRETPCNQEIKGHHQINGCQQNSTSPYHWIILNLHNCVYWRSLSFHHVTFEALYGAIAAWKLIEFSWLRHVHSYMYTVCQTLCDVTLTFV